MFNAEKNQLLFIYVMEQYAAIEEDEIMKFTSMWLRICKLYVSEISQREKDEYKIISFMWDCRETN